MTHRRAGLRITALLVLMAVASLMLTPGAADAARKEKETKNYVLAGAGVSFFNLGVGGVEFTAPKGTTLISLDIRDQLGTALGQGTAATVCQDNDGNGTCGEAGEVTKNFCTKTQLPVPIVQKLPVSVFVRAADTCGTVPNAAPAVGSSGTVTATYFIPKAAPVPPFPKILSRKVQQEAYPFATTIVSSLSFAPPAKATHVQLQITDAAGQALGFQTAATACQDNDDNSICGEGGETNVAFCTKTTQPLAIKPGVDVTVFVDAVSVCPEGGTAIGSTGMVKATFLITAPAR